MSLMPFGQQGWGLSPYRSRPYYDPFNWPLAMANPFGISSALDHFFDDTNQLFRLRDHAAKLELSKEGNFSYKVDVSGFQPQELKVAVEGNDLVVRGEHREQNQGEQVERSFYRRVRLPEGINRESVKCDLNERGHLRVCGQRLELSDGQKQSIPIEFKPGDDQQQATTDGRKK